MQGICRFKGTTAMFSSRYLPVFSVFLLDPSLVYCLNRCGQKWCAKDQICCGNRNSTCCKQPTVNIYSSIAVLTRKLSGILIILLLFAVGYFIHRILCSRSRQPTPSQSRPPPVTTSRELLMESCPPEAFTDPAPFPQLPSYDECNRLPTYEETIRDGNRGPPGSNMGQAS
uniref:Transmembrane protein 92 n=1 Tax=Nothobranchius furzeri TaxID=105023 RepID=A0A8C6PA86_NOTFU